MKLRIVRIDGRKCHNPMGRHYKYVWEIQEWQECKRFLFFGAIVGDWVRVDWALSEIVAHNTLDKYRKGPDPLA